MIGALAPALLAAAQTQAAPPPSTVTVDARRPRHAPGDPLEHVNRRSFRLYLRSDRRFIRPAALGYARVVPRPVRHGIANFFGNLGEPLVFLSYLLELKPGKAAETAGRFLINSTLGIGGLVDVAAQPAIRLRHRENSIADALGYYGVKPGPYLFLPIVGPTTLRDLFAGQGEGAILPGAVGGPFRTLAFQLPRTVTGALETRAENDAGLKALLSDAVDPYATFRSTWLQDRQGEIDALHGHRSRAPAAPELSDPLADPSAATSSAPAPAGLSDPLADPAAATPAPAAQPAPTSSTSPGMTDPLADPAATPAAPSAAPAAAPPR